jgi:hypothetical protein
MRIIITSDRPAVYQLALAIKRESCALPNSQVAAQALREFYDLTPADGIWGGSEAAICMGYAGHSEEVNLFEAIAADLAAEL